ncbi:MAG: hypothetical protein ACUVTL_07535 [Thermoproteota archaeon]
MPIVLNLTWPAAQITIQYIKPDSSSVTRTVLNSLDGTFTDTFTPDVPGQWSIKASWQGNNDHNGATSDVITLTVTEPTIFEILEETGMIYVIPVAIVAVILVIMMMRKRKTTAPLPPPPTG